MTDAAAAGPVAGADAAAPARLVAARLVAAAVTGERRAVARLLSLVETDAPELREISAALVPHTGRARVIGLTGPPGVGKSTSTSALVGAYRAAGRRVGVLAVDPSSPFTGGAVLGDRVRMTEHAGDREVFVRSMASRGQLGGLSRATPLALRVLDAAGCDVVLIETVGVGQAELDIATLADTTCVLVAPGAGDGIQAAKAGLLEAADVLVVNKSDHPGAEATRHDLAAVMAMADVGPAAGWRTPVVRTAATRREGLDDLIDAIDRHQSWLAESGELARRRLRRAADEICQIALASLRGRWGDPRGGAHVEALARDAVAGRTDPYQAADRLLHSSSTISRRTVP